MICELCGKPIELGDAAITIEMKQLVRRPRSNEEFFIPLLMEDGSKRKVIHPVCVVGSGAPLGLIGAGAGRIDV